MSFVDWMIAGFSDIIPVIPPVARMSILSKIRPADLGKIPGVLRSNGTWSGFVGWQDHGTTDEDIAKWNTWYPEVPSIGLRAARFPAVDIDCTDAALADVVQRYAERILGGTAVRTRSGTSKRLMAYRTTTPFRRMRLWFRRPGEDKSHLVEVLGSGQHYLIEGKHADGSYYEWQFGRPNIEELPEIDGEKADAFLRGLADGLRGVGLTIEREGGLREAAAHGRVSTARLEGSLVSIRDAVGLIPNTTALFPGRDDYLRMGYAIKAALPHDPDDAFNIWWAWCDRWEGNRGQKNEIGVAWADWERMVPPFSIGADWILEQARPHGYSTAEDEFNDGVVELLPEPARLTDGASADTDGAIDYSDAWIAKRAVAAFAGRVRYTARLGGWLFWDDQRWTPDTINYVAGFTARICREAGRHALQHVENVREAESIAKYCGSDKGRKNVLSYLTISPELATPVEAYDRDIWGLNTPGGILDLRTGLLTPTDPDRLFTRCTAVAPSATVTPKWSAFLAEATGGDRDLEAYLQRLAGYSLTGSTREHMLAFLWGPGGNGKGVFLNTLVRILGGYATVAAMDTFTSSRYDRHPTELAALFGARVVTAQETQEGRAWDEAKVKSITGGDPISARYMRQDFFTFQPQFTLLFAGNHKPRITNLDDAMRRRFHLVPFITRPVAPNPNLVDELEEEWSGILQWAVEGCMEWQRIGLAPPAAVLDATSSYFADEDPIGRWILERTEPMSDRGTETRELFADWKLWCMERNERVGNERSFVQSLLSHGLARWAHPTTRRRGITGISIRAGPGDLPPLNSPTAVLH